MSVARSLDRSFATREYPSVSPFVLVWISQRFVINRPPELFFPADNVRYFSHI
jgi:hypothetical protein